MLRPDVAKFLPCWLSQAGKAKLRQPTEQRLSNIRTQQKKSIGPILFLYHEESLVSSNFMVHILIYIPPFTPLNYQFFLNLRIRKKIPMAFMNGPLLSFCSKITHCQAFYHFTWQTVKPEEPSKMSWSNSEGAFLLFFIHLQFHQNMDFVKSHFEKMKLWTVEQFWLTFFLDQHWSALISTDLEKKWAKSVQLVKVFPKWLLTKSIL